jgi:hypothetical protein
MSQCANSGGEFYDSYYTVQGTDTIVPVNVSVPGRPPRPEALVEGILMLREKIAKQQLRLSGGSIPPVFVAALCPPGLCQIRKRKIYVASYTAGAGLPGGTRLR